MNKPVPSFFYSENRLENPGAGFVTKTTGKHFIAKVILSKTDDEFKSLWNGKSADNICAVDGYRISLVKWNIDESFNHPSLELIKMAEFYFKHTIEPKLSYYSKYKI